MPSLFYLNFHNICKHLQSAFLHGHNTEADLLKIVNDLFLSLNKSNISILALLVFSIPFSRSLSLCTVSTLTFCLQILSSNGFHYLTDRKQYVSLSNYCFALPSVNTGVPLCSFLVFFFLYVHSPFVYYYLFAFYHVPLIW